LALYGRALNDFTESRMKRPASMLNSNSGRRSDQFVEFRSGKKQSIPYCASTLVVKNEIKRIPKSVIQQRAIIFYLRQEENGNQQKA